MKIVKGLHATVMAAALVGLAAAPAAAQGRTSDRIPTNQGDLVIHPVHHGTLVLEGNGRAVYVDPAPGPGQDRAVSAAPAFKGLPPADIFLITDIHGDHYSEPTIMELRRPGIRTVGPQAVIEVLPSNPLRGGAARLAHGRTITVHGIQIEALPMYNLTRTGCSTTARSGATATS